MFQMAGRQIDASRNERGFIEFHYTALKRAGFEIGPAAPVSSSEDCYYHPVVLDGKAVGWVFQGTNTYLTSLPYGQGEKIRAEEILIS